MENFPNHSKKPRGNIKHSLLRHLRVALFAVLPMACASTMQRKKIDESACVYGEFEATSKRGTGRKERKVLNGDEKIGTVRHVRQLHGTTLRNKRLNGKETAAYQLKILEDLLADQPDAILNESLHHGRTRIGVANHCPIESNGEGIRCYFDGLEASLTTDDIRVLTTVKQSGTTDSIQEPDQKVFDDLLYDFGAGILYGIMFKDEHTTWLQSESNRLTEDHLIAISLTHSAANDLKRAESRANSSRIREAREKFEYWRTQARNVNREREKEVIDTVERHLKKHPGTSVTVIYGFHNFRDDFALRKRFPILIEVHYDSPGVMEYVDWSSCLGDAISDRLEEL